MARGGFNGGFGGGMNMNMIKQAQKMQQDMLKKQAEIEAQEFSASSGGGMVTAVVTGKREVVRLEIDESAIIEAEGAEDVEMISDAVIAAVNEALRAAETAMNESMSKITGGLGMGF